MATSSQKDSEKSEPTISYSSDSVCDVSFNIPMIEEGDPIINGAMIGAPVKLDYETRVGSITGRVVDVYSFDGRSEDPYVHRFDLLTDDVVGETIVTIQSVEGSLEIDGLHGDSFNSLTVLESDTTEPIPAPSNVAGWELLFHSPWGAMWCTPPQEKEKAYGTVTKFETVTIIPTLEDGVWACLPSVRSHASFKTQTNGWHEFSTDDILAYAVNRMEKKPQNESSTWFRGLRGGGNSFDMEEKKELLTQYDC